MSEFDNLPLSPSEDFAPPPAYEFSQQEYDQKIQVATEQSQQEQDRREERNPLEEWESWDEALFEANAAKFTANQANQSQGGPSSSSTAPSMQSTSQGQGSTSSTKAREAMGQDPYYSSDQYASAAPVRPLSIQKKKARPSSAGARSEKERPSWYNEAQLGDSSGTGNSSGQQSESQSSTPRRTLPTPGQLQSSPQQPQQAYQLPHHDIPEEPEDDHTAPPPPFAPIGESLDGPAYERYPGEAQRRASGAQVVLTYGGGDLSASPPPSPLQSPVTPVQELDMRRRETPPRINSSPSPYHMQYQAPQASRRPSRQTLVPPPPPPPIARQHYVPPPPRMDFNPSVAYESSKSSIFGQLPMDTLKRGEGAAALYKYVRSVSFPVHVSNVFKSLLALLLPPL